MPPMSEADTEQTTASTGRETGEVVLETEDEPMTTASTSFKPKEPKFGGITQTGPSTWAVWTGGKPNVNWTELEEVKPKAIQPNQYRMSGISGQAKAQAHRRKGLEKKFSRKDDLQTFQHDVMEHFEDCGIDTPCYIEDPTNRSKVIVEVRAALGSRLRY